jgi:methionine-rich copper-binding protein CopC
MFATMLAATGAAPAAAHNDLVCTTPTEGAVQNRAPTAVVFEFSEEIDPGSSRPP